MTVSICVLKTSSMSSRLGGHTIWWTIVSWPFMVRQRTSAGNVRSECVHGVTGTGMVEMDFCTLNEMGKVCLLKLSSEVPPCAQLRSQGSYAAAIVDPVGIRTPSKGLARIRFHHADVVKNKLQHCTIPQSPRTTQSDLPCKVHPTPTPCRTWPWIPRQRSSHV